MQHKENDYLNEEKHQKSKKKLGRIARIIMSVGVLAGVFLIVFGQVKAANIEKTMMADLEARLEQERIDNENLIQQLQVTKQELEAEKQQSAVSKAELESQIEALEAQKNTLSKQQTNEFLSRGFSEKYYDLKAQMDAISRDISKIRDEIWDIDRRVSEIDNEIRKISNGWYDPTSEINVKSEKSEIEWEKSAAKRSGFFAIPIIMFSLMAGGILLATANRRGMMAFQAQAMMPVANEGLGNIAPTLGRAAEQIARGFKRGMSDEDPRKDDLSCPFCKAPIQDRNATHCEYCRSRVR